MGSNLGCGLGCLKFLLFAFNFVFWLSGLALLVIGAILKVKYGVYLTFTDDQFANAPVFLIAVGAIVFIVGFLGCCGAMRESYCMVMTFAVLLGIIFVLEIAAGALGFVYRGKVEEQGNKALERAVNKYEKGTWSEEGAEDFMNWVQPTFKCCGKDGPGDYSPFGVFAPGSCCGKGKDETCLITDLNTYKVGCSEKLESFFKKHLLTIGGAAIGIAFIQLLGILFACCYSKGVKDIDSVA